MDIFNNAFSAPLVWIILVGVVLLSFANRSGGKGAEITKFVGVFLAAVAKRWKPIIFGIPMLSSLGRSFVARHNGDWAQRWMDKRFADSKDPMLRGSFKDRLAYAQDMLPISKFRSLWVEAPEDLRRSLVSDGKLINGAPLSVLAEAAITSKHLDLAARAGATAFVVWFSLMLTIWHPGIIMGAMGASSLASVNADVARVANDDALIAKTLERDYWDSGAYKRAAAERKAELMAPRGSELTLGAVVLDLAMSLVVAIAVGLLMAYSSFRAVFRAALSVIGANIHDGTKEQVVRWKQRLEQRKMEYTGYCEQLKIAREFDRSPLIDLGKATGMYRFRGKLDSPYAGQRMKLSFLDTKQHMLVFGGTGQGKTREFIKPVLKQVLEARRVQRDRAIEMRMARLGMTWAQASQLPSSQSSSVRGAGEFQWPWGIKPNFDRFEEIVYPLDISTYLTDGKAVFYHDMREIAATLGLSNDLMVIGANEQLGEVSVDLLDLIAPQVVADNLKSIAKQAGGGGKADDFWPNLAAEVLRNCAVVARAFDHTDEGVEWVRANRGERPYSLVFIYQLAVDTGPLLQTILEALDRTRKDPNLFPSIKEFYTIELFDACTYLQKEWLPMVSQTRDGIKANITDLLSGFCSNPALRASFSGGSGRNQVSADQFWGRLCVTNVSTQDYGNAGRIINVFLKILFQTEAVKREKRTKAERAALEHKFFQMFPSLAEVDRSIEKLAVALGDEASYTPTQRASFLALRQSAEACVESLTRALIAGGVQLPEKTGGIESDIGAMGRLLDRVVDAGAMGAKQAAEHDLGAYRSASRSFRGDHPALSRERVFLSDMKTADLYKIKSRIEAACDASNEIVETARELDPTVERGNIVQKAHELIHKWRVVNTRLDGGGEGAIREQMFFFGDEYQTLITIDTKEGAMSDSSYPNVARSTGVSLIIATQSFAAFKQAVGADSCENFCNQFRTKIFMMVEDTSTTEYIKKLSGKALRSHVFDPKSFESYDAMRMETDVKDFALDGIPDIEIMDGDAGSDQALAAGAAMALTPSVRVSANDAVNSHNKAQRPDMSYIPALRKVRGRGGSIDSNEDQRLAAQQQARWRADDMQHKDMTEGNQEMDVFRDDDFTMMARGHAYMYVQRAGKTRQDFVQLDGERKVTH